MFNHHLDRKKSLAVSLRIGLSVLLLTSLSHLSQTTAQSPSDHTQATEPTTSNGSSSLNLQNSRNSHTNNESNQPSIEEANESFFNPPNLGAPVRTAEGGARSDCPALADSQNPQHLTILIQGKDAAWEANETLSIAANTVSAFPTFLWYIPKYKNDNSSNVFLSFYLYVELDRERDGRQMEPEIERERANPVVEKLISLPKEVTGIVRFQIPETETPLDVGKWYSWKVFISKDEEAPHLSSPCVASGYIGRRPLTSDRQAELDAARNLEEFWNFYSKEIIWYDALATLDRMRRENPDNQSIQRRWEAYLGLIGLGHLSEYPPVYLPEN